MSRLAIFAFLLSLLLPVESTDYDVVVNEKTWSSSCDSEEDEGNTPLSELVNISDLTFVLDKDFETLYISGDITVKLQIPKTPIEMEVNVKHWERSHWEPTIISLKRDDFCKSMEDPFEVWHTYVVTQIPKDQRTCPPELEHVYSLRNFTNRVRLEKMPHWDVEGDLKAVVHFTVGKLKTCIPVYFTITIVK
ncbi:uncharacterized protein LOC117788326 [Drosophila innubila]|uniref:uncharacterized protein LOC117788326 n=1 Tax=Drosophila innubila TaxID=198719 RepID=UPI00148D7706|nr:uncharacterized protein LOC117788326 [Drosophila innubila]